MSENNARKLLARAKSSPYGWTARELRRLYTSFDFGIIAGAKHDLAKHLLLPEGIKGTITRSSGEISPAYIEKAVELIEMVLSKEE